MKPVLALIFGIVFGFLLSRSRATDYQAIVGMFLFTDLHLAGVMSCAIASSALGLFLVRRSRTSAALGGPLQLAPKPFHRGVLAGGIVFGVGWALTGACPGTALAQIGEGKLYALATAAGILAGTWAYRATHSARGSSIGDRSGEHAHGTGR